MSRRWTEYSSSLRWIPLVLAPLRVGHRHGSIVERDVGVRIDDGLAQMPDRAPGADVSQVRAEEASLPVDRVAVRAAVLLVDDRAGRRRRP